MQSDTKTENKLRTSPIDLFGTHIFKREESNKLFHIIVIQVAPRGRFFGMMGLAWHTQERKANYQLERMSSPTKSNAKKNQAFQQNIVVLRSWQVSSLDYKTLKGPASPYVCPKPPDNRRPRYRRSLYGHSFGQDWTHSLHVVSKIGSHNKITHFHQLVDSADN